MRRIGEAIIIYFTTIKIFSTKVADSIAKKHKFLTIHVSMQVQITFTDATPLKHFENEH